MPSGDDEEGASSKRKRSQEEERKANREKSRRLMQISHEAERPDAPEAEQMKQLDQLDEVLDDPNGTQDPSILITEAKVYNKVWTKVIKRDEQSVADGHVTGRDLMKKILERFARGGQDDGEVDWETFNKEASLYFAVTPPGGFLAHSLCKDIKPRKARAVAQREKQPVVHQRPNYEYDPDANTDRKNAMNRYRQLAAVVANLREPIPVSKLVLDPNSLEESIYNFFAFTALLNDHKAALVKMDYRADNDDKPVETIMAKGPDPAIRNSKSENQDMSRRLEHLDKGWWRRGLARHSITEPFFKFDPNDNTQASQADTQAV